MPFSNHCFKLLVAFCLLCASAYFSRADAFDNWTTVPITTNYNLFDAAYGNGRYIVGGQSKQTPDVAGIFASDDGFNWITVAGNGNTNIFTYPKKIIFANGRFVAVGWAGGFCTSTNGLNWEAGSVQSLTPVLVSLYGLTFGNGKFVAVGDTTDYWTHQGSSYSTSTNIFTSTDGINWTPRRSIVAVSSAKPISSVTYGNGNFLAVGEGGYLYSSSAAISWTRTLISGSNLASIIFGNGTFVVANGSTSVLVANAPNSIPGWTPINPGDVQISRVRFDYGVFWGFSYDPIASTNGIVISRDGTNWIKKGYTTHNVQPGNIPGGNRLIASSGTGVILSDLVAGIALRPGLPPQLDLSGITGSSYRIEYLNASPINGSNTWQTLTNFILPGSPYTWTDSQATNSPQRYYRAVLLP
ncbi:MAG: cell wall/surface repeat protein [Pedosphaera sp.]|nr:cell wall/surface repeat protein [Pedosphaera sp.]